MTVLAIPVQETSRVAEVRRRAGVLGAGMGFSETDAGRVSLVASELATNLVRHAGHGEMLLDALEDAAGPYVQLIALDRAAGIADLNRALEDGYSTAGTAGTGLGAVGRTASRFDAWSHP
ncbi:MAG: ATP-binding protein, partial [Caulobacteraceae bacterium]